MRGIKAKKLRKMVNFHPGAPRQYLALQVKRYGLVPSEIRVNSPLGPRARYQVLKSQI